MDGATDKSGVKEVIQVLAIGARPRNTMMRLGILISVGMILIFIFSFVILPVQITGPSMQPTYANGQINFINRLAYLRHEPQRGDVVGIRFSGTHTMYVKRIVGMPGETLKFFHGVIYINGEKLDEPYLRLSNKYWQSQPRLLGPEEYYVVGDNRSMRFDDHEKGAADRNRIIGKIFLRGTT